MALYEKIAKIMFDNSLSVDAFLSRTGFSKGTYYSIKNGEKTELSPEQASVINKAYPEYTFDWLTSVSEPREEYREGIGVYLNNNHERLLVEDATYGLWFDKMVSLEAIRMLKELLANK
jgi:hypothetical protein